MSDEIIKKLEEQLAERDGQLAAKNKELDTATKAVAHSLEDNKKDKEKLLKFEKAERAKIEEEVHALDPDYKVEGIDTHIIQSYKKGFIKAQESAAKEAEAHGAGKKKKTKIPNNSDGNSDEKTDPVKRHLDG